MMNIVIVGAGDVGRYIATILSKEEHNVILIDTNLRVLEEISSTVDVAIRQGTGTDWHLLDELLSHTPDLLIALTGDDATNLVCCNIAKHLGYPRTIARIKNTRFLNQTRLDFARMFDVDYFINPELLVAHEILKKILHPPVLAMETFAHGAVQMITLRIPAKWRKFDQSLKNLVLPEGVVICLIRRETEEKHGDSSRKIKKIIFPHGSDYLLPGDEVTIIGETDAMSNMHEYFGIHKK